MSKQFLSKAYSILPALVALVLMFMMLPMPVSAATGIRINIISVKKNESVVVEAVNFPANETWTVRVGPFYTFAKEGVKVDTFKSEKGGTFRFTVKLPRVVKDVDLVAIRLDSDKKSYAYNAFNNRDIGGGDDSPTSDPKPNTTPAPSPTPTQPATSSTCSLLSATPTRSDSMPTRYDFDAVWEVKNTSSKNWETSAVDYKYISGDKFYKRGNSYDLPQTVKPGEKITIRVDMLAPDKTGTYTTNWAITQGDTTLCSLPLTITVK